MQNARTTEDRHAAESGLVELSVVLVTNQNDPSILNPDFLRYTGIVDKSLKVSQPPISTPVLSYVVFDGDIGIRAEPNRFVFEQKGQPLNDDECVVPPIAGRFVQELSHINYTAIGINAKILRTPDYVPQFSVPNVLIDGGVWMAFRDISPDIHLRATYTYESRRILLDVGSADAALNTRDNRRGLLFQVNIHRDISERVQDQAVERTLSVLRDWKTDLSDCYSLLAKFPPMEIPR